MTISLLVLALFLLVARLCAVYMAKFDVNVTSCSNVLYDVELCVHGETLEDVRSFLFDARLLDLAVNTYGNYKVLACQR